MKILTLNTHAWAEEDQLNKISQLADFINTHQFDVISMQEVNQSIEESALSAEHLQHFISTDPDAVIKRQLRSCLADAADRYLLLDMGSNTYRIQQIR